MDGFVWPGVRTWSRAVPAAEPLRDGVVPLGGTFGCAPPCVGAGRPGLVPTCALRTGSAPRTGVPKFGTLIGRDAGAAPGRLRMASGVLATPRLAGLPGLLKLRLPGLPGLLKLRLPGLPGLTGLLKLLRFATAGLRTMLLLTVRLL